jgi:hypothetical protein
MKGYETSSRKAAMLLKLFQRQKQQSAVMHDIVHGSFASNDLPDHHQIVTSHSSVQAPLLDEYNGSPSFR